MHKWSIVYRKAYNKDGSLFFPKKLTKEFLDNAKKNMGSFLFANQYLNEVFPEEDQRFKESWFRFYQQLPETEFYRFAMIDPAMSTEDGADYTGIVVVNVDSDGMWFVEHASRNRFTPTQIVQSCFDIYKTYPGIMAIGIESVAYQKALIYMLSEEMQRRNTVLPLKEVHPGTDRTKEARILALVPRFEWGRILLNQGLDDLILELSQFPRSTNDDIADALALIENIIFYPQKARTNENERPNPNSDKYESWFIRQKIKQQNRSV